MAAGDRDGALILYQASYRHYLAGRADPVLGHALGLRALGVSGLLSCQDGWVFGRRSAVVDHCGQWELVPSGGAETTNLKAQILKELDEEIGLSIDQVVVGDPIGLIEGEWVVDAVFPLSVSLNAAEITKIHAGRGSAEYDQLHITASPADFIATCGDAVMPITRFLAEEIAQ